MTTNLNGVGITDLVDLEHLAVDAPAVVQTYGDRVLLNLNPEQADLLAKVIAEHEANDRLPLLPAGTWLPALTRLLVAAVATDPRLTAGPVLDGSVTYLPILGQAR